MAINSHADLFSLAAYLCQQQESMSVNALSRVLEAVAKSIKHATAMSTMLAIELFQARRHAAIASSKLLLEHSCHELRNAPINSQQLFDSKVKEVAKPNYKAQQHRFLASSASNTNIQQQNLIDLNRTNCTNLRLNHSPIRRIQKRTFLREVAAQSSSPPLNMPRLPQSSESQPFPLPVLSRPDIQVGGRLTHFVEQWGKLTQNKWALSIVRKGFRIPFNSTLPPPPPSIVPISLSQSSSPLLQEEIMELLQKQAVKRVQDTGTPSIYSRLFLVPKKNGKLRPVIDLSLLNQYIKKQPFKMETVKSVRQSILVND